MDFIPSRSLPLTLAGQWNRQGDQYRARRPAVSRNRWYRFTRVQRVRRRRRLCRRIPRHPEARVSRSQLHCSGLRCRLGYCADAEVEHALCAEQGAHAACC
jgi:hypothetical protein